VPLPTKRQTRREAGRKALGTCKVESTMATVFLMKLARAVGLGAACPAGLLYGIAAVRLAFTWQLVLMVLLALVAGWASITIRPFVLVVVFFVSFFPIGLYLTFTPSFLQWIGVCDVLYLVTGGQMLLLRAYQRNGNGTTIGRT